MKFNSTEHACFYSQLALSVYYAFDFFVVNLKKNITRFFKGRTGHGVAHVYHEHCLRFVYFVIFDDDDLQLRQLGRKLEAFCCFCFF